MSIPRVGDGLELTRRLKADPATASVGIVAVTGPSLPLRRLHSQA